MSFRTFVIPSSDVIPIIYVIPNIYVIPSSDVIPSMTKSHSEHLICQVPYKTIYRTRAIISRSRLVAAPLRNHAKKHFLCDDLKAPNFFLNSRRAIYWRGYGNQSTVFPLL